MTPLYAIILAVALQRLGELVLAQRNTKRLKAAGAQESGNGHYPLFILLHASWLIAITVVTPPSAPPRFLLFVAFLLLEVGRLWVMVSLGRLWTTRIITLPSHPIIKTGPYRFLRHPNYLIVAGEIAILPLMFDDWKIAVIWSLMNGLLLARRIRQENRAIGY